MASTPNNIVAKDSDGNIKKIDLDELLQGYVKTEDIPQMLSSNWPACLKDADLSLLDSNISAQNLDSPLLVERVSLTTAPYGDANIIDSDTYTVDEPRMLSKTSDAYRFVIAGTDAEFAVCSTKKCFLYLTIDGISSFSSNVAYEEEACRASRTHGGNPIILDWANVALAEGGTFNFSFNESGSPFSIFGTLTLSSRISYVGNVHRYNFVLDFILCGSSAWKMLKNANALTFQTTNTSNETTKTKIDLTSIAYPKIVSVGDESNSERLSENAPSSLAFRGENGIVVGVSTKDESNVSLDEKEISISMNIGDVAGDGLEVDQNGKLTVPVFTPSAGASNAIPGLVPGANAARFDDILTVSGWKSFSEIGLDSALKPFVGATRYEDGDMGFVPQPLIANAGMFLKGDGTWANAVSEISGTMECDMSPIERELSFGVSLCDANGEWMFQARQCSVALSPTEVEEGSFEIDIPLADIHGVSLCSPWSAEIPVSAGNNDNGWVADKTFWASAKTGEFSGIFRDGSSIDVWLSTRQDAEIPEKYWTVVHYRGHGCKTQFSRPFILSIDGTEQGCNCSLADDGSTDIATAGSVIKVWPTSAKTRILSDFRNEENEEEEPEEQTPSTETPWGGYIWVNQERTAMLQSGALAYIGDPIHPVYAVVAYQEHPAGSPVLVYGLQEQEDMWDIILQEAVTYNDVEVPAETVIGHVWKEGTTVKAASQLFANWSIQPTMQESDEEISLPSDATPEQPDNTQPVDEWITLGAEAIYVPSLGLELSKSADGVHVHAPAVNIDAWPRKANSIDLVLDAGFTEEVIDFDCISNWLNTRFEGLDKSLANMERRLQSAGAIFTGATSYSNGLPGLVPPASSADTNKVLMGDGTWSDQFSSDFVGADGANGRNGKSGLVPAPGEGDANKYLRGDGTWASPVYEFNAVSGVSVLETPAQKIRQTEYDLSSVLDQVNALLQENQQREVYISIPEMEIGLEMPENNGLMIHAVENEGHACIEIGEIAGGIIVASTVQMPENLEDDGNGNLLISWNDNNVEIGASVSIDEQTEALTVNSLTEWPLTWSTSISGLKIDSTNTVTGEENSASINLSFAGATESTPGRAGLTPQPQAGDNEKYLRGDGTWAELTLPDTYQGATEESDGIAGLVPAASIADRRSFLRGDGTWASAAIEGACVCTYANVKKQWTLGVNICDGDGSWLASAVKVQPSIRPNEILTYTLNLRFGADGPGGCALWNPYNATQPINAEERTYEFYRDATVWGRGTTNHFIQTFSDGITMDCWIEVDETQTGYHNLKIAVYGPKAANVPRLVPLNVDGTNTFLTVNLAAGGTLDIPVAGNEVKIYPRPTYRTVLWRNEISEWSGNASTEPVVVTETAAEFPYLAYTVQRTETGIRIVADDYSLADWPVELASAVLNLSAGGEQTTINLGCIPAWVSNELQKIDEAIEHASSSIDSIGLYKGATENENGVAGLVPPASSAERNGTLHGDGTWGSDVVVTETMPTASDAGTVFFYIED